MTLKNASGDSFEVYRARDGYLVARQITGRNRNYCGIPCVLCERSMTALRRALRSHYSN